MKKISRNKRPGLKAMRLAGASSLLMLGLFVSGCPAAKTEKVVIRGSNTVGEELAPRLIAAYRKEHPGVDFDLESKGTGYGLGNLLVGACDIAAASRMTNQFEMHQVESRGVELNDYVIGFYSVAVIVNGTSPVESLTKEQVRDIFTGAVQNWKDVGGPDAPIHVFIRDPISGTHLGFQELAMENKPYGLYSDTFTNYLGIAQAVAKDIHGIGYSSIELATNAGVKGVTIGGVVPTIPNVNKGEYSYTRVLRLYTNKMKEAPAARDFIQFIQSPKGQEVLVQMGYVPRS